MGGLIDSPVIKLAKKFGKIHSLAPPIDIEKLVKKYASLIYRDIPITGVDGVSINLKKVGKIPKVVASPSLSKGRLYFTLAHELGHIIIPWHIGTIADNISVVDQEDYEYYFLEQEANQFAAEILMPSDWILNEYQSKEDLAALHNLIHKKCNVSYHAAAIRMIQLLPSNIIYIAEESKNIAHSGKTQDTSAGLPDAGNLYRKGMFPYTKTESTLAITGTNYHWIELSSTIAITSNDARTWREILNTIVDDIMPHEDPKKYKMSINGIVAAANSVAKRRENYSLESITSDCIYRFSNRPEYQDFVGHQDFEKFIISRSKDFFTPK